MMEESKTSINAKIALIFALAWPVIWVVSALVAIAAVSSLIWGIRFVERFIAYLGELI